MRIQLTTIIILNLFIFQVAQAQPGPWMKKVNPEEIGLFTDGGEQCPPVDLGWVVSNQVLGENIEPKDVTRNDEVYLDVRTLCVSMSSDSYAFHVEVFFGRYLPSSGWVYFDDPYRSIGVGSSLLYREAIRQRVGEALVDYSTANFISDFDTELRYDPLEVSTLTNKH